MFFRFLSRLKYPSFSPFFELRCRVATLAFHHPSFPPVGKCPSASCSPFLVTPVEGVARPPTISLPHFSSPFPSKFKLVSCRLLDLLTPLFRPAFLESLAPARPRLLPPRIPLFFYWHFQRSLRSLFSLLCEKSAFFDDLFQLAACILIRPRFDSFSLPSRRKACLIFHPSTKIMTFLPFDPFSPLESKPYPFVELRNDQIGGLPVL